MAPALVPSVERERMDPVEPVHPARHGVDGRLEHQVVVRGHQTVRVEVPLEAVDALPQECHEAVAIDPVAEDRTVADAERRDVEDAVRQLGAQDARHLRNVRARRRRPGHRRRKVTLP